jgi:hypothetical protein
MQIAQRIAGLVTYIGATFPNTTLLIQPTMPECSIYMYGTQENVQYALLSKNMSSVHTVDNTVEALAPISPHFYEVPKYLRKVLPPDGPFFKTVDCSGFAVNGTNLITKLFWSLNGTGPIDCVHPSARGISTIN